MPQTQTNPPRRPAFVPNVTLGTPGLDPAGLRQLAQSEPREFAARVQRLIDERKFTWSQVRDLRHLFHALSDVQVPVTVEIMGAQRTIMASAFPVLTGGLTIAGVNDAYAAVPTIGGELVTEMEDAKKYSVVAGIHALDNHADRVNEGDDFPLVGATEEKFTIAHKRNGRRIQITGETLEENDVAGFVERVNALGEFAAKSIEKQTLRRVCDIDGSATSPAEPYVLHIAGAGVALYQTDADPLTRLPSSGNRVTNNALADSTDLDAALTRLAGMKDQNGDRIQLSSSELVLLAPFALEATAAKILGSSLEPGVENELNNWGPQGRWRPRLLTSTLLDDLSTTAWYLGNFRRQFKRKWKLRMEYVTLAGDTQKFLESRIAFQARIAWDCEVGATDYVYVVQNLAATTAP